MFPFITIIGRPIGMYAVMILLGILVMGIYVSRICKKNCYNDNDGIVFLLIVSAGVLIGGHILYSIVNYRILIYVIKNISTVNSFQRLINIVGMIWGGSVFYGGLLGGILTAVILIQKRPQYGYLLDITAPSIPLFHFFGRIGCFLGGCCFGIESAFGFTFHNSLIEKANGVSRFPVQLLEAFINLLIFFILNVIRRKGIFRGNIIYIYLLFYSVIRFFDEFLRGDEYRGFFLNLSTSQIISVLILLFVAPKIRKVIQSESLNISYEKGVGYERRV